MSVTSGFFNGVNYDRMYDALQVSQLFDGLIRDGVFASIGNCFVVSFNNAFVVNVGTGRAWFDHTWTYNDAVLPVELPLPEILLDRIDAVVIDVNWEEDTRKNDIIVVKGTPAADPVKPTMLRSTYHNQYPIAFILQKAAATKIEPAYIENAVGTEVCPFVTGILDVITIDQLIPQWREILNKFVRDNTDAFTEWFTAIQEAYQANWNAFLAWEDQSQQQFLDWFTALRTILEGDDAGEIVEKLGEVLEVVQELEGTKDTVDEHTEAITELNIAVQNKQEKAFQYSTSISTNWVGSAAPFENYIECEKEITDASIIEVTTQSGITKTQVEAFAKASITGYGVLTTTTPRRIRLRAWGTKPTIALPVDVVVYL